MGQTIVPMLQVPDVRATVEWYESVGFRVVATYGNETAEGMSFGIVAFGESEVMFNQGGVTSDKHRREVDLYIYTDGVDEIYERLKDRVDVVKRPHNTFYGTREVIIRDNNRFWISFSQESLFTILMEGAVEGKPEQVQKAVESGQFDVETLSVALAASGQKNEEIVALLRRAGAKPAPEVDLATLQSYAGKYRGDQGPEVEMTVKDGKLFAKPAHQQPMSLWPLDQTTFKPILIEGATIIFDSDGLTFIQTEFATKLHKTAK